MAHNKSQNPHDSQNLEAYLIGPNKGKTARCQVRKKDGNQCNQPARRGFAVCKSHGAGTAKRVKNGSRQPINTGRPIETGEYSSRFRVVNLLEALESDIPYLGKNLNKELMLARLATAKVLELEPSVTIIKANLENHLPSGQLDYDQAMNAAKAIFRLDNYMLRIQEMALNIAKIAKAMADIENSSAQTKALDEFRKYAAVLKNALRETLDYEQHEAIWQRIQDDLKKIKVTIPKEPIKN
jgi:hypothetical protein